MGFLVFDFGRRYVNIELRWHEGIRMVFATKHSPEDPGSLLSYC